ncbi:MAG: DUF3843 family protein [Bacteroidales bacterium]|nr:DUF3843 family protein [Bacteroidales bacterium]
MITREQFLLRQPSFPKVEPTDPYYYDVACKLFDLLKKSEDLDVYPDALIGRAALCIVGYLQDVIADCGVWRSFVNECRRLYGRTIPFYEIGEDYVDYELNREDVRFLMWYALSMYYEPLRLTDPLDSRFEKAADACMTLLSEVYDDAPVPEGYMRWRHVELNDPEDTKEVVELAQWLFMHSYLLTPAFALTLSEIMEDIEMPSGRSDKRGETGKDKKDFDYVMRERLDEAMQQMPTGPLAMFTGEWVTLVLGGSIPEESAAPSMQPHKYYTSFIKATGGKEIAYFQTYDELNRFFIDSLGWEADTEHLPMMKEDHDFVLLVNHDKGLLVARNVARCIAAPDNSLYDREYAATHAINLLTVRGVCPADLLHYICERGWLPDARFPGSDDTHLVADNYDFIARCYLQLYYRGD